MYVIFEIYVLTVIVIKIHPGLFCSIFTKVCILESSQIMRLHANIAKICIILCLFYYIHLKR